MAAKIHFYNYTRNWAIYNQGWINLLRRTTSFVRAFRYSNISVSVFITIQCTTTDIYFKIDKIETWYLSSIA